MGCACSRATSASDEIKNELREKHKNSNELESKSNKCVNIKNNSPPPNGEVTDATVTSTTSVVKRVLLNASPNSGRLSSQKHLSSNAILRPFTNLFGNSSSSANRSTNYLNESQGYLNSNDLSKNSNLSASHGSSNNQQLLAAINNNQNLSLSQSQLNSTSNRFSNSQFKQTSQQPGSYSLYNLPIKTQHLLNSHDDLERLSLHFELSANDFDNSTHSSKAQQASKKLNNEIQAYLSLPYVSQTIDSNVDSLLRLNINLIDKHLNDSFQTNENNISNNESDETLFENLRFYCAQHKINNTDLNIINLNNYIFNNNTDAICDCILKENPNKNKRKFSSFSLSSSASSSTFSLINNKYFRRSLAKSILYDLFNIKTSYNNFSSHQFNSFLPSFSLFIILLSETQFEQDTNENLLCPDSIDLNDYRIYLEKSLHKSGLSDLFQKYYKLDKHLQLYKLEVDFFNLSSLFNEDLDKLLSFFLKLDDEHEHGSTALNSNSLNQNFKLKYLKSIQQDEIEIIINNADPQSIIWAHLTKAEEATPNTPNKSSNILFNKQRYSNILNLLQTKVLTNKYKQIQLCFEPEHNSSENENNDVYLAKYKTCLNEFIFNSVKNLIDIFVIELNKNQSESFALRIDKQLSQEIYRHYEFYKYFKSINNSNSNWFKFESILNDYSIDKSTAYKHPLVICNDSNSNSSPNKYSITAETNNHFNILTSKWLTKQIQANQQADHVSKTTIIYRFCNYSVLSSEITTLLQSVLHQLCYILEIHESCAFDSPENIVENVCKALEHYFSISDNERKEIVIYLNNLDSILRTNADLSLFLNFLNKIYHLNNPVNLKLILTLSASSSQQTSRLIKKIEHLFTSKSTHHINIDLNHVKGDSTSNSSSTTSLGSSNTTTLTDKLNQIFFKNNNDTNIFNLTNFLLHLLNETRYGLKQTELFDLVSSSNLNLKIQSKKHLNYILIVLWYSIKYYSNSIEFLNDNNQLLYKINHSHTKCVKLKNEHELNDLIYSFYNRSSQPANHTRLISHFNKRVFYELPKYFFLNNKPICDTNQLKAIYLNEFVLNPKWILNKSILSSSFLHFLHDLSYFKSLFEHEDSEHHESIEIQKAKHLESILYQNLYNLSQDQNRFYLLSKLDNKLESLLSNLEFINKSSYLASHPQFFVFNNLDLSTPNILFDQLNPELKFYSKLIFISKYCFLTLSEAPFNEIRIWRIDLTTRSLSTIRTIKFNKPPKDLRLINRNKACVLIDRNLHLIDLDQCAHVFDLNSTMNPSFAFFEIHDSNHVVLLARNRLSVILMKVPMSKQDGVVPGNVSTSISEDMFLFKVGEDRYLNSLLVSRNGKIMVCGDEVQKPFPLLVWNLDHRKLVYDLRQAKHEFITSIQSISSSGKYVVSACQEDGELKNCLIVYDLTTGQLFKKLKAKENFVCVEISEESNVIIACLENSQMIIYDLDNGSKKFTINLNRFPINKIKILDTNNKNFKNYFLTYDTQGYDWAIRLWDLTKGDQLISSITCTSRIISLDVNTSSFYFDEVDQQQDNDDDLFITVSLYGVKNLLILKLDQFANFVSNNSSKDKICSDSFSQDETLNGLSKEINL